MIKKFLEQLANMSPKESAELHTQTYIDVLKEEFAHELRQFTKTGLSTDKQLAKAFPKDVQPTTLFYDFAALSRVTPWGAIGGFNVVAESVQYLMPQEADVEDDFAMFMHTGDGGAAGLWLKDTRDANKAPLVWLDSEGQMIFLAPDFLSFLDRIFNVGINPYIKLFEFAPTAVAQEEEEWEKATDLTSFFAEWFNNHPLLKDYHKHKKPIDWDAVDADTRPQEWLDNYCEELESKQLNDPSLIALAEILTDKGFLPEAHKQFGPGFNYNAFRVFCLGETMKITEGSQLVPNIRDGKTGLKKISKQMEQELREPLFKARENFAFSYNGVGLWPSATLKIWDDGRVAIEPNYDHEFSIGYDGFDVNDFVKDHKRFPRKKSKLADWHREMIAKGKA